MTLHRMSQCISSELFRGKASGSQCHPNAIPMHPQAIPMYAIPRGPSFAFTVVWPGETLQLHSAARQWIVDCRLSIARRTGRMMRDKLGSSMGPRHRDPLPRPTASTSDSSNEASLEPVPYCNSRTKLLRASCSSGVQLAAAGQCSSCMRWRDDRGFLGWTREALSCVVCSV